MQSFLSDEALKAVKELLPETAEGVTMITAGTVMTLLESKIGVSLEQFTTTPNNLSQAIMPQIQPCSVALQKIYVDTWARVKNGKYKGDPAQDGNTCAQEELLKKESNNVINGVASRNNFQLIRNG